MTIHNILWTLNVRPASTIKRNHQRLQTVSVEREITDIVHVHRHMIEEHQKPTEHNHEATANCTQKCSILKIK